MVPRLRPYQTRDSEALILNAIEQKRQKGGGAFAAGKTLIVSWVVGLQGIDAGEYVYGVTNLDLTYGNAPTVLVRISRSFDAWQVTRIQ
jgi:hypothetical protein